jgi:hypothetical protein
MKTRQEQIDELIEAEIKNRSMEKVNYWRDHYIRAKDELGLWKNDIYWIGFATALVLSLIVYGLIQLCR